MTTKILFFATVLSGFCFASCTNPSNNKSETSAKDTVSINKSNSMKSFVSIFEIPATEISRAINFYQIILDIKIEKMNMPEMQMGI